jgi:hypothetical protein
MSKEKSKNPNFRKPCCGRMKIKKPIWIFALFFVLFSISLLIFAFSVPSADDYYKKKSDVDYVCIEWNTTPEGDSISREQLVFLSSSQFYSYFQKDLESEKIYNFRVRNFDEKWVLTWEEDGKKKEIVLDHCTKYILAIKGG